MIIQETFFFCSQPLHVPSTVLHRVYSLYVHVSTCTYTKRGVSVSCLQVWAHSSRDNSLWWFLQISITDSPWVCTQS